MGWSAGNKMCDGCYSWFTPEKKKDIFCEYCELENEQDKEG